MTTIQFTIRLIRYAAGISTALSAFFPMAYTVRISHIPFAQLTTAQVGDSWMCFFLALALIRLALYIAIGE